jgi:hypothetical protein
MRTQICSAQPAIELIDHEVAVVTLFSLSGLVLSLYLLPLLGADALAALLYLG